MKAILIILLFVNLFTGLALAAPPANDNFASASVWTATAIGTNAEATAQTGEPAHAGNQARRSVWWNYTAAVDGPLKITSLGSGFDTVVAVYTGNSVGDLSLIDSNDDLSPTVTTSRVVFNATAGTTYRIALDGFGGAVGALVLDVAPLTAPLNDNYADAEDLGNSDTATATSQNFGASAETGEPAHAGQTPAASVWWLWTAPADGLVTADTVGSGVDTVLGVYTGLAVNALTPVAANDDGPGLAGASSVTFPVVAGQTYSFAVDSFGSLRGSYVMNIAFGVPVAPSNDDFESPTDITPYAAGQPVFTTTPAVLQSLIGNPRTLASGLIVSYDGNRLRLNSPGGGELWSSTSASNRSLVTSSWTGTNANATIQAGEPQHAGRASNRTVWFSWTAFVSGPVTFSTFGSPFDTLLAVYTGTALGNLALVAGNDDAGGGLSQSRATFTATAGTTYQIAVGGFEQASGPIQLSMVQLPNPPPNDNFNNRINLGNQLENAPYAVNFGATAEVNEIAHAGAPAAKSVWWQWTAPREALMFLTLEDSGELDTRVAVYTGTAFNNLTLVAANDDRGVGDVTSAVNFRTVPGTTYYIAVDTKGDTGGEIFMTLVPRPRSDNDDFANAEVLDASGTELAAGAVLRSGSNFGDSSETSEPAHAGKPAAHSLWWTWTATEDSLLSLSSLGSDFDTRLAVYTGGSLGTLVQVASNDNEPEIGQQFSQVYFQATAGTTYHFALDGNDEGYFNLRLERLDASIINDAFESRIDLGNSLIVNATGSNLGATAEVDEPAHRGSAAHSSLWWSWTAPASGFVEVSTDGSSVAPRIAVYSGSSISGLVPVLNTGSAENVGKYGFYGTTGRTYIIAADGVGGDQGEFAIAITPAGRPAGPTNDNFANRQILAGEPLVGVEEGSSIYASREVGEPAHGGQAAVSSVWYQWSAPFSGSVTLDCSGAPFLPRMAIYTGSKLTSLNLVAESGASGQTQVVFQAVAGTTYQIAIDAYGRFPSGGEILFSIFYQAPANDNFADAIDLGLGLPSITNGANPLASAEAGEPSHGGHSPGASVWWKWTADTDGLVTISMVGSNFDTVLGVYVAHGAGVSSLSYVAGNDNINGATTASAVTFQATSGTTYQIAVDGFQGAVGLVSLSIEAASPPGALANDLFANAADLGDGHSVSITSSSETSTPEVGEPNHAGNQAMSSVWWKWTSPVSANVTIDTLGSSFDTILGVYTGATLAGLVEVGANDDTDGGTLQSTVVFAATAGTEYYIAVDGFAGANGTVHLNLSVSSPDNDFFASRMPIGNGSFVDVTGSNAGATNEPTEPSHAGAPPSATIWWTWTAPANSAFAIAASSGAVDTVLAVYTGNTLGGLSLIQSNNDSSPTNSGSSVAFNAIAGTVYQIAVGGAPGAGSGAVRLIIQPTILAPTPANDSFASATNLYSAYASTVSATNVGATSESGEPGHGGAIARDSVWWEWTAPFAGSVTFDTIGSSIDTRLAVYTGNALPSLALVAQNDDASSGVTYSRVSFPVSAGIRYRIAVDGFIASEGPVVLRLDFEAVAELAAYASCLASRLPPDSPASAYSLTADTNGDSIPNGIAFLLGAVGDARPVGSLSVELQGANLVIRYPRGQDVPSGFEKLQGSPDFTTWSDLNHPVVDCELTPGVNSEPDTMQVTVPKATGYKFFRLAVGD